MMVINNSYEIGEKVYLVTDTEQLPRLIICIEVFKEGELLYKTAAGTDVSTHYDFELSRDPDMALKTRD